MMVTAVLLMLFHFATKCIDKFEKFCLAPLTSDTSRAPLVHTILYLKRYRYPTLKVPYSEGL